MSRAYSGKTFVKTYTRRTKSGKRIKVRTHTRGNGGKPLTAGEIRMVAVKREMTKRYGKMPSSMSELKMLRERYQRRQMRAGNRIGMEE